MNKYLTKINVQEVVNKKIKKDGSVHTIVFGRYKNGSLYLVLVENLNKKIEEYGKQVVADEIKEISGIKDLNRYEEERDATLLFPTILQVKNPMLLRPKQIRLIGEYDFENKTDWNDIFKYNCGDKQSLDKFDYINYPFIKNGKPVSTFNQIDFTTEEKQLRQIFINSMEPEIAADFIKEFKAYCLRTIRYLNEEYVLYTKEQMKEFKKQFDKVNNDYIKALQSRAKAKQDEKTYYNSLEK